MIAPIFIRSETLSLKRNSKKNVACNYCIEKKRRVYIYEDKNGECNFEEKTPECNGKKTGKCLQSWPFSTIVAYASLDSVNGKG
jgi:hypothetical protein